MSTRPDILTDSEGNSFRLERITCPICGPTAEKVLGVRGGAFHRYGLGVATSIVQCTVCSLMYPNPFAFPLEPQRLYGNPGKYFSTHNSQAKVIAGRALIREACRRLEGRLESLLDVGSGRGELLHAARLEQVARIVGLDFAESMVEDAARNYGARVELESIEQFEAKSPEPFDVVFLNAVLEHVYDPDSMIAAAQQLTRPGGVLYIDTPNEPSLLTRLFNSVSAFRGSPAVLNLSPTFSPFHVFGFNPRSLTHLLGKYGFVVESVSIAGAAHIPSSGGLGDRLKSLIGTGVNHVANWTGSAANMCVWARRHH
jgi:SAM-dependent methyltransferase